jgi:hypothetical protein
MKNKNFMILKQRSENMWESMKKVKVVFFRFLPTDLNKQNKKNFERKMRKIFIIV